MAGQIIIQFKLNSEGKKDLLIKYDSDDDALPHEHETRHRQIVEQLIGRGMLEPDDLGKVLVERVSNTEHVPVATPQAPAAQTPQKQSS